MIKKLFAPLKPVVQPLNLSKLLFLLGIVVYLLTRFIRLPDFPIYFFTDEAIQAQHAADLISNGFRGPYGVFLPTYFENGGQFNLSLSVYIQVLPTLIFGKSIWVTRGFSAAMTLLAVIFTGLTLKNCFNNKYWWLSPVILAATPTWFLHSRTAFETVLMVSMYSGFLYYYLRYRQGRLNSLYAALAFGALAFYSYSPGQVVVVLTGLFLLIADARYHWEHRITALKGLGVLALAAIPYLRFMHYRETAPLDHLTKLGSYWVKDLPLYEKLGSYFVRYIKGFNPLFWFWPNPSMIEQLNPDLKLPSWLFSSQHDLIRHTMKGYGHILIIFLPFWIAGLVKSIRKFKDPGYRTLVLALLAAPSGAALVDWGITRGMVFVLTATLLTIIGLSSALEWIKTEFEKIRQETIFTTAFIFFTFVSGWLLYDALRYGPYWFREYGLWGMQYGAEQVFTRAVDIAQAEPETQVLVSSTWTNGTSVLMRYFTDDLQNVELRNINAFIFDYQPLNRNMLFVMTDDDFQSAQDSKKFKEIDIVEILPYPDGTDGFYFVRLEYVDNIQGIMTAERLARQMLQTEELVINDQKVLVQYPLLDMNEIKHVFDQDPVSFIRTLETNPLRLVLSFSEPIALTEVTLIVGGIPTRVDAVTKFDGQIIETLVGECGSSPEPQEITLKFDQTSMINELSLKVLNIHDGEIAHVHLWEVSLE